MLSDSGMCGQKGKGEVSKIKSQFFSLTVLFTHKDKSIFIKKKSKQLTTTFLKNCQSEGKNCQNGPRSKSNIPVTETNFYSK